MSARAFLFALIIGASGEQAFQLAHESMGPTLSLDMGNRAGEVDFCRALHNVERGRAKFALATNDVSGLEMPFYDGVLVEFEEGS